MIGEAVREFGVLITAFMPLDNAFEDKPFPLWVVFATALVIGCGSFVLGVHIERRGCVEEP